jgi:hypothetical protein
MRRFLVMGAVLFAFAAVSIEAQTVLCESIGNMYRECRVGSSGTIRLVMEMSDRACFEGSTWGTRQVGMVWVDRGCRATFTVAGPAAPARGKNRVVCESHNGNREVCPAATSGGVILAQQLSKSECVQGETWGFESDDREQIWVDRGCRAEFILGRSTEPLRAPQTLDKVVVCESMDGRRKECAADTAGGVQIVRQLSDSACGYGRQWGFDEKGIWVNKGCRAEFVVRSKPKQTVRAIVCESENNARNDCAAETQFGVALVQQLSENECVLGKTWGFDQDRVWVTEGCRARFALGGYRLPAEAVPPTATKMLCESLDGGRKQCPADTSRGVGLIRQISGADCVLNRTWGYDRNGIWVTDGCRAEFAVAH